MSQNGPKTDTLSKSSQDKEMILSVQHVSKRFISRKVCVRAVTDVSFDVRKGETIGIMVFGKVLGIGAGFILLDVLFKFSAILRALL